MMPPGEGSLFIGAEVDKGAINQGMADVQEITRKAAEGIGISFQECSTKTKAAMRNISEDVKTAAQSVSQESIRVAEATKAQAQAFTDLRRATIVTRDEQVDAALAAKLLAAAQQKVATAAEEKAAAVKASAEASAKAAEEESLSANVIVRAWQRAAMSISESTSSMNEHFTEVARNGKLSGYLSGSGFGAMGELLGAGIAVQMAGDFLEEAAKINVELGHLSEQTGISVQSLSGLRQMVKETGMEFEPVQTSLIRFERNLGLLSKPSDLVVRSLEGIGVKLSDLQAVASKPEEALNLISGAMARTEDHSKLLAAAITLFGRGGAAVIPILKEHGAELGNVMQKTGEMTGITDQSVAASQRWTRNMAIFSAEFHKFGNFAIENMHYVVGAFDAIGAGIQTVLELIAASAVSTVKGLAAISKLMIDIMGFRWTSVVEDAKAVPEAFNGAWKAAFKDIGDAWKETASHFKAPLPEPQRLSFGAGDDDGSGDPGGKGGKGAKVRDLAFQRDEDELNALKVDHEVSLAEEKRFWEGKLATATKGSAEYRQIMARLAGINQRMDHQKAAPGVGLEAVDTKPEVDAFIAAGEAQVKANNETQRQVLEAFRSERDEEIRLEHGKYADLEQDTAFEVRQKRMTAAERIEILRKGLAEEYAAEVSAVRAIEAVDVGSIAKYQQDLNRELELKRQHDRQIVLLNQQAETATEKGWQTGLERMTSDFNRNVTNWIVTGKGFAQSMAQMISGITQTFVQNVVKMTEQYLLGILLRKQGQKSEILGDAKASAAGAYKAVVGIPIVGPVLAPIAAATAFAGVMAFESFDQGGTVSGTGAYHVPILAKQGERILTPHQNSKFEQMVDGGGAAATGNKTGGERSVHVHYSPTVHAFDRQGFRSTLNSHKDDIVGIVRDAWKSGALRTA